MVYRKNRQTILRRATAAFVATFAVAGFAGLLAGCLTSGEDVPPRLVVRTLGEDGGSFRPDSVTWYRIPLEAPSLEYHASCLNAGCTRWGIDDSVGGRIYVEAHYTRTTPDPFCRTFAEGGRQVDLDSASRQVVTIVMEEGLACI